MTGGRGRHCCLRRLSHKSSKNRWIFGFFMFRIRFMTKTKEPIMIHSLILLISFICIIQKLFFFNSKQNVQFYASKNDKWKIYSNLYTPSIRDVITNTPIKKRVANIFKMYCWLFLEFFFYNFWEIRFWWGYCFIFFEKCCHFSFWESIFDFTYFFFKI